MKFLPGSIVSTPGALHEMGMASVTPLSLLRRHLNGDWGDLEEEDKEANNDALIEGNRILSAYVLETGEKVWIITEWDRSVTTFLLPSEY